ncbi:unnamed protein product [Lampetra planeri]
MALVSWGMRERWVAVSGRSQCLIRPALSTLRPLQILHAPNAQPPPVLYSRPSDNSPGSPAALCSESSADELEVDRCNCLSITLIVIIVITVSHDLSTAGW